MSAWLVPGAASVAGRAQETAEGNRAVGARRRLHDGAGTPRSGAVRGALRELSPPGPRRASRARAEGRPLPRSVAGVSARGAVERHAFADADGKSREACRTGTYLDIAAYLLEANGLPPGQHGTDQEVAAKVLFVAPGGPRPLPTSSPARDRRLHDEGDGDGWFLTSASRAGADAEPLRVRGRRN